MGKFLWDTDCLRLTVFGAVWGVLDKRTRGAPKGGRGDSPQRSKTC